VIVTIQDQPMPDDRPTIPRDEALRRIPPVHELVDRLCEHDWIARLPRPVVTEAARRCLDDCRAELLKRDGAPRSLVSIDELAAQATLGLQREARPMLESVINATGIIIHTGLGRAPLPREAVEVLADIAAGYAPVELDLPSGERGKRTAAVAKLLCELTGAEAATVVNNNTAALVLSLTALARDREVIVSRGELIEIGGSFRLPDIIEAGGAKLREVGTTNKSRIADYENAINDRTGAIIKIHSSNYRVEGFTEEATIEELVELGRRHDLPLLHDIGSGVLVDPALYDLPESEPNAAASIRAGSDLVMFSGDKLLGGPQAGIIVGRAKYVACIEQHPMMRAMRVDKITLGALGETLRLHRDPARTRCAIPVLAAAVTPIAELEHRGRIMVERLRELDGVAHADLQHDSAYIGGGSVPAQAVESVVVALRPASISEGNLATRLRAGRPAVVPRVGGGHVCFDLRTISPDQDRIVIDAVAAALRSLESDPRGD
jgi:L-seryl-tRNA(Ser) seleniumtransferase